MESILDLPEVISDAMAMSLALSSEILFARCSPVFLIESIFDARFEWFSLAKVSEFSERDSLLLWEAMDPSNFFIEFFFLSTYLFIRAMERSNPSMSLLMEISFVSFEIFEFMSMTTVPPFASKYSPAMVTDL